jgi:hypothetical protein
MKLTKLFRTVTFSPTLAEITGSVIAGIFLSYTVYQWQELDDSEMWIVNTYEEVQKFTGLNVDEINEARSILRATGLIAEGKSYGDNHIIPLVWRLNFDLLLIALQEA